MGEEFIKKVNSYEQVHLERNFATNTIKENIEILKDKYKKWTKELSTNIVDDVLLKNLKFDYSKLVVNYQMLMKNFYENNKLEFNDEQTEDNNLLGKLYIKNVEEFSIQEFISEFVRKFNLRCISSIFHKAFLKNGELFVSLGYREQPSKWLSIGFMIIDLKKRELKKSQIFKGEYSSIVTYGNNTCLVYNNIEEPMYYDNKYGDVR